MSVINDTTKLGNGGTNLVLETAGRVYIKVNDRFYELDFKNQNKSTSSDLIIQPTEKEKTSEVDLSNYVTKKYLKNALNNYITTRGWSDVKATQKKLEEALLDGFTESINPISIQTMQLIVGTESLQFDFIDSLRGNVSPRYMPEVIGGRFELLNNGDKIKCPGTYILHHTLDGPESVQPDMRVEYYARWQVTENTFSLEDPNASYYIYIRAPKYIDPITDRPITDKYVTEHLVSDPKGNKSATFVLSESAIELESEAGFYHFLCAIVTDKSKDSRSIAYTNGFTEILPGQVTAYIFKSGDGVQFLDFLNKQFHIGYAAADGELATEGVINDGSYLHWDTINGLVVKGNFDVIGGPLKDLLDNMQAQIDDEIQTWFSSDENNTNSSQNKHIRPTINSWPADGWLDDNAPSPINPQPEVQYYKKEHLGDLYYITDETYQGEVYRFIKSADTYEWRQVLDNSIAEAIAQAYAAMQKFDEWAADDKISPDEISSIENELKWVNSDFAEITNLADKYNLDVSGTEQNPSDWDNFVNAKNAYVADLQSILTTYNSYTDKTQSVPINKVTFRSHMEGYYNQRAIMLGAINDNINTSLTNVSEYVVSAISDGVLTVGEIETLNEHLNRITDQYNELDSEYDVWYPYAVTLSNNQEYAGEPEMTALIHAIEALYQERESGAQVTSSGIKVTLDSCYDDLTSAINAIIACGVTPVGSIDASLADKADDFNNAVTAFKDAVKDFITAMETLKQCTDAVGRIIGLSGYEYLKEAIQNGKTSIQGGLVFTNTLALGNTPDTQTTNLYGITAGINGITYLNDGTEQDPNYQHHPESIAAWFGGPFRDKLDFYNYSSITGLWTLKSSYPETVGDTPVAGVDYAKTLFRHDGTGYTAGGAISWDANGTMISNNTVISGTGGKTLGRLVQDVQDIATMWFEEDQTTHHLYLKDYVDPQTHEHVPRILYTAGDFVANRSNPTQSSDARLKTNVNDLKSAKDVICAIRPVSFEWNEKASKYGLEGNDVGVIAQEVEKVVPNIVSTGIDDYKQVNYAKFIPYIIATLQEHEQRIEALEKENGELKSIIENNGMRR